jgi:hypothetical protein
MFYWLRVGDQSDYAPYDDLDTIIQTLNEWQVGEVSAWMEYGIGVGLETMSCYGYDFISLFVGDDQGNLIRPLKSRERAAVEEGVTEGEKIAV